MTREQLHYVDDGELLALMAGAMALPVRTHEDCELLDACGREFRERKGPCPNPDQWDRCSRCHLPALVHDTVFGFCPHDAGEAAACALELVTPEEWEQVRPYIFGQEAVA